MGTRRVATVLLLALLLGLVGCFRFDKEPVLNAVISPEEGIVPYTAQIVATAPPGTFTFDLPNSTIEQDSGSLEVLVDHINWTATVTWTDGETVKSAVVTARGTNARPIINPPRISGIPGRWYLEPRQRTLIDFSFRPASLSAPRTGVDYTGDWAIWEISVECSQKVLCDLPIPDSIFCPPYEEGVYHALFNNQIYESSCIVYPTWTYEIALNGVLYSPIGEDGYTYDAAQQRNVFHGVEFPAQTAKIRVAVEDEFGRLTQAEFEIPVKQLLFGPGYGDGTQFDEAQYFVAGEDATLYHRQWCYKACQIAKDERVYFCDARHAEESDRKPCPYCFGNQPSPCECLGDNLDCEYFATQADAQSCFEYCKGETGRDVHGLDADGDGIACESLP